MVAPTGTTIEALGILKKADGKNQITILNEEEDQLQPALDYEIEELRSGFCSRKSFDKQLYRRPMPKLNHRANGSSTNMKGRAVLCRSFFDSILIRF